MFDADMGEGRSQPIGKDFELNPISRGKKFKKKLKKKKKKKNQRI